jgi:hypothetical protein
VLTGVTDIKEVGADEITAAEVAMEAVNPGVLDKVPVVTVRDAAETLELAD